MTSVADPHSRDHHRFIEPLDVLILRGNKLFGAPGSHGESLVPPWPSVAAGALRSAMLAADGVDFAAFVQGRVVHPVLGTPAEPGPFTLTAFTLARRLADGGVEELHAAPADLVVEAPDGGALLARRMSPLAPAAGLQSSAPLPLWPVLAQPERVKALGGVWLTGEGWRRYLAAEPLEARHLLRSGELWMTDDRVGVGLDAAARRASDGKLFSVQAVAFHPGVGFLATVRGAEPPSGSLLRLGGDGRGAALHAVHPAAAAPDLQAISNARRARLVFTSPALLPDGWRLPGLGADGFIAWPGLEARIACAAVPRAEVVSGWDLARRGPGAGASGGPKPADRCPPAGSVYWLDELDATPEMLGKLAERGLWFDGFENEARRAEGFNRFTFAAW